MVETRYGTSSPHSRLIVYDAKSHLTESPKERFVSIILGGSLLAFNAGFVNVVSLLISNILVSHTTGNITKSSVLLAEGHFVNFLEVAIMLPCFVMGSCTTTLLVDQRTFHLTKQYNRVFLICTMLLVVASIVGIYTTDSLLYAYLATIACGMQNALTTKYSGSILRTTHTTGMATDIGICLGRILKGKPNELWKLQVQVPLLCAFFLGGVMGAFAHELLHKHAMFVSVGLFVSISALYVVTLAHVNKESLYDAAFGRDQLIDDPTPYRASEASDGDVPIFAL